MDNCVELHYSKLCQWYRGLSLLREEAPKPQSACFDSLCYMVDCSRNGVPHLEGAKRLIRYLAIMGYDSMMLYTEDTYTIPEYPYFGHMRGRYSEAELKELDAYAASFGIELIPCIQVLAHLENALRWKAHRLLRDNERILLTDDPAVYELIEDMFRAVKRCFTSRRINLGMDEAFQLGLGRHLKFHGYEPRSVIMQRHVEHMAKLCEKYELQPMMWSDMFYRLSFGSTQFGKTADPTVLDMVPRGMTLIHWDYLTGEEDSLRKVLEEHQKFHNPIAFAGGAWKWYGFTPSNRFSLRVGQAQLRVAKEKNIRQMIVTGWGDDGAEASQFCVLPVLSLYAETQYGCEDHAEERFRQCFGMNLQDFLLLDLPDATPDSIIGQQPNNPSKYLLYNDPMAGLLDRHALPEYDAFYADAAIRLQNAAQGDFKALFVTLSALCKLLSTKATLGSRLHAAYAAGDRTELSELVRLIREQTLPALEAFRRALLAQWESENKPFGWEVLDLRLGGLRQRLETTAEQVEDYASGRRDALPLLQEDRLPFTAEFDPAHPTFSWNRWHEFVSANTL